MMTVRGSQGNRWHASLRLALFPLLLLLVQPAWMPASRELVAAESATAADSAADENLKRLLSGGNPLGIADLRAMQSHVQKLTEQLNKATVGVQVGNAQGSGVIITKDGYVLTAAHVAGKPNKEVDFFLADGRALKGKTLGLNRTMDAGLMKITDPGEYPFAEMGVSDGLKEGQWCLATGHPGGYQSDRGIVLRLGRVLLLDRQAITTDCTLVGGDSGGPLFDMQGRVIGINSRIAGSIEANMHVPVSTYRDKETWDRLNKGDAWGHYPGQEPYIGVRGEQGSTNAKVASVVPDSPAAKAGLQPGDVVLKFGDQDLTDFPSLSAAVRESQPDERIELTVQRGQETIKLNITLGKKNG
jgi:S1-C subfamily serine protease